ncbi:protein translocase subunit SecD, partial [Acinetobacter baumannii]
ESGTPAVAVTLSSGGAKRMFDFTSKNVGKPMAVLFREVQITTSYENGQPVRNRKDVADVINQATIRGVFGKTFQTTGLSSKEAHDLSLLL